MKASGVPEHVRRFLLAHVSSIEQLEVLLLLRATPARRWSAEEVNLELKSSVASIGDRLILLASEGFLAMADEGGRVLYRYAPGRASDVIDDLATAYRERRLAVIEIVYERPESDAVIFSEAFKIARPKEGK